MKILVNQSGIYLVDENGLNHLLDTTAFRVNANGSLTLRIPARDVQIDATPDPLLTYDMNDFARCLIAVWLCGLPLATVSAVRPAVATAIQTFMTNNSLTASSIQ